MKTMFIKTIYVLCKPVGIDEVHEEEYDNFNTQCARGKWLYGEQIGIADYDENIGFFKKDINFTHFAYYGEDHSSSPLLVVDIDDDNDSDKIYDALSKEDLGVEKNSKDWEQRVGIACHAFSNPDESAFLEEYDDWFDDNEIVSNVSTATMGDISIDLDELKCCNIETFMGYKIEYEHFDYSDEYFDADGKIDIINFLEKVNENRGASYIDEWELIGYAVTKIDEDDNKEGNSEDDNENNYENKFEETDNNCGNNDNKIFLDKIINIKNIFPDNICKIRFMTSSRSFDAVNEYINNPEKFNTVDLFYKFSKKELFNIGDIVLGFLRIENDIWILTTVKKVTKVLEISNGQNYEGEEIEEFKPFFGRLKVLYHNKVQNLVRYYDGLCDEIIVHSILPEKFSG